MSDYKRSDQAEGLRSKMIDEYKQENGNYPPRSEVHNDKEKKAKFKMKYPVISLLALFFILLPVLILSMNVYFSGKAQIDGNDELVGEDTVFISNGQNEEIDAESHAQEENSAEQVVEEEEMSEEEVTETMGTGDTRSEEEINVTDKKAITPTDESVHQKEEAIKNDEYKEIKTHKVATGETLFKIAVKYYNSREGEEIIRQYNGLNGNNIYVGQVLKIPIK